MVQGELFREDHPDTQQPKGNAKAFFSRYRLSVSIDKLLIGVIGTGFLFVLAYSFGVERGKRAMEAELESMMTPAHGDPLKVPEPASAVPDEEMIVIMPEEPRVAPESEAAPAAVESPNISSPSFPVADLNRSSDYTVQLVTYQDEAQTIREVNRLKAGGHEAFVIPSSNYFQVCANYYRSVSNAAPAMERFRTSGRYPDAFVRPVVR